MKLLLIFLLLASSASSVFAQASAPDTSAPASAPNWRSRPLPPSILAELRRSQKGHTLAYHDTIRANDLERMHFNDTTTREYADSALAIVDTAVALSHKEWLDSELVEIPELSRLGSHIHFNYPPSIMTETDLNPVPFDSSLVERMNPVTLENLPFFDQTPLPMPLTPSRRYEAFIEAGAGNVDLPRLHGWMSQSLSQRTSLQGNLEYNALASSASAIHNYLDLQGTLESELGEDPAVEQFRSQDLKLSIDCKRKVVALTKPAPAERALSDFSPLVSFTGDASPALHYFAQFEDHELGDDLANSMSESSQSIALGGHADISEFRAILDGRYEHAAANGSESSGKASILLGQRAKNLEWFGGLEYLGGTGPHGDSHSSIYPIGRIRLQVTPEIEAGAIFEPQVYLSSYRSLLATNAFYRLPLTSEAPLITATFDGRAVAIDNINFEGFLNYFLSADNVLRFVARYVTRSREPVFETLPLDSSTIFIASPQDTRMVELTGDARLSLFERDVITASFDMRSATVSSDSRLLPFEPSFQISAGYHSYSIWDNVWPSLLFRSISLPGRTFAFLDLSVEARLSKSLKLIVEGKNLLSSASDFWPGYPEYPLSFVGSLRYSF